MKLKWVIITQCILLIWFFLDMTGLYINGKPLVTTSILEDGIFMLLYLLSIIFLFFNKRIGKYISVTYLSLWFLFEFMAHEYFIFFKQGILSTREGKIRFYEDTIKLFTIDGTYIPDLYHIILHILVLTALITIIIYIIKNRKFKTKE